MSTTTLQAVPRAAAPAAVLAVLMSACLGAGVLGALSGFDAQPAPARVRDIPADFLAAYESAAQRFKLGADGWSYLAGIGKVESDHGRSTAPGVHSGQNSNGCCAGPMQINNGGGSGGGTWGEYEVDGDGDGRLDIYDPADAITTAARYLRASGAPSDWRAAIFAYNHASWYVDEVERQAAAYRDATPATGGDRLPRVSLPVGGDWLAPVPGFPGIVCDRRIVPDVVLLVRDYGLRLTACFGGAPHAVGGEHPLGLATDLVPANGDWSRTMALARAAGWAPDCSAQGCAGRGPFRVVLYNGYPGHGDPAHSATPHLHLSWQHAPARAFTAARWVRVLTAPGVAR